jgi:hypothetical protein
VGMLPLSQSAPSRGMPGVCVGGCEGELVRPPAPTYHEIANGVNRAEIQPTLKLAGRMRLDLGGVSVFAVVRKILRWV